MERDLEYFQIHLYRLRKYLASAESIGATYVAKDIKTDIKWCLRKIEQRERLEFNRKISDTLVLKFNLKALG